MIVVQRKTDTDVNPIGITQLTFIHQQYSVDQN